MKPSFIDGLNVLVGTMIVFSLANLAGTTAGFLATLVAMQLPLILIWTTFRGEPLDFAVAPAYFLTFSGISFSHSSSLLSSSDDISMMGCAGLAALVLGGGKLGFKQITSDQDWLDT